MSRLSRSLALLLIIALAASGCTLVVSRSAEHEQAQATGIVRPTEAYIAEVTTAPVIVATATIASTPTALPPATSTSQPTPSTTPTPIQVEPLVHIVAEGETLSGIADMYSVSLDELVAANSINDPASISVGQKLIIPAAGQPAEATPTTPPAASPTATAAPALAATPATEPTAAPTQAAVVSPGQPSVSESTVTVMLPEFERGLYPLRPEEIGYPYDGLDLAKVGPPVARQYRALILENAYTSVMIIPDLGGRIYRITDKASGKQVLYNNPGAVPTNWGMRGWWFASGGIEWCIPTEEHGLVEYLPWNAKTEQSASEAAVVVSTKERLTGVDTQVRISLDADHSYVHLEPSFSNGGSSPQKLQFWLNAMYAADSLHAGEQTRLVLPAGQVLIHSTSDPGLPGAGKTIPWPGYGPRDLSVLSNWHGYIGAFASPAAQAGFMGAQTPGVAGLLRAFPPATATGAKFFGLGDIPSSRYSQSDSSYLELWGGWTTSFWDYQTLAAGQSVRWQESWYPLPDMPPVVAANNEVALAAGDGSLALAVTRAAPVEIEAYGSAGQSLGLWRADLTPGSAWLPDQVPSGITRVEVRDRQSGKPLLTWPG
jgi:LysM repeat protein